MHETIEVPSRSLDALAAEHAEAPGVIIKMDIQGHEPVAIRGMAELLGGSRPLALFMEVTPKMMSHDSGELEKFAEALLGYGFDLLLDINEETGRATPLNAPEDLTRLLAALEGASGFERSSTNLACFRGLLPPRTRMIE